ncbi:hypothetical protein KC19_3G232400 [Ceratodon purpureus]|uniref:Auxin efflux carrier component n=1 Tax=Ceratodon purpureus TaxID=3225 RepID=A0A8T0ILX1_CERPU|nr:hypothetical protein KC19_3G232400 [Ceratodon purpureus]KAG0584760.1 hypothetical protein KC19_3G232400 [Ceratodon purpureus]
MITGHDFYNVLSAMVPLYVAMILAYGSVKWWGILTPQQCGGINRFVSIFAVPLLSFQFISGNNPYEMNFRFIAADAVSKVFVLVCLGLWVRYSKRGSLEWMITLFVLITIPNTLVMGTPLLAAMYGAGPGSLTVQAVVLQCIIWYTLLLIMYEYRAAKILITQQFPENAASIVSFKVDSDVMSLDGREPVLTEAEIGEDGKLHVKVRRSVSSRSQGMHSTHHSMPSSKALTPRPSNLTGAEIYSMHSSVNLTPRDSSFNQGEFYSMMSQRSPHRQSNFDTSDVYSLQSSRGPTPRTSNFNEENSKDMHTHMRGLNMNSPRFAPPLYRNGGGGRLFMPRSGLGGVEAQGHGPLSSLGAPGMGPDGRTIYPGSNTAISIVTSGGGANNPPAPPTSVSTQIAVNPVFSPRASQIAKKVKDPRASPKTDEDAKELHMFVWSANASPVSEAGLHVFGGNDHVASGNLQPSFDPKEVRMLVHPQSDHGRSAANPRTYDEYSREDFSFGNRNDLKLEDIDKDGPRLDNKFGSTSTAELTPKLPEDEAAKGMPPSTVMIKLIAVMTFRKLVWNPNTYSSLLGVIWSLIAFRWHFEMPIILYKSVHILSDAGLGMAMFSLGLFMGLGDRIIVCGTKLAVFGMALRFLVGPAVFAAASYIVGLRGVSLNVSIVQAALPQGIVPFVFAKEYNVHPEILSTAVIFGMLVALPITLLYYILLGL